MKPHRFSLTFVILSSTAVLLVLTWFLLSLISFKTAENDLLSQKNQEVRILLASFVNLYAANLESVGKGSSAGLFAERLSSEKSFAGLTVVNGQSRVVFSLKDKAGTDALLDDVLKGGTETYRFSARDQEISRYAPVIFRGSVVGAARLTLSLKTEYERLQKSRRIFLAYFVLDFLLLLGFGSYLLSRFIVVPIRRLLAATERIAAGDLPHRVSVPGCAEIAALADAFNKMVESLKRKQDDILSHVQSLESVNRELQTARQETMRTERMASVGLLAAGTAHEIGTPLAAVMGYTGILLDELQDDAVKADYLKRIESELERIDRIVRGLLDYARPTPSVFNSVDVVEVLTSTLDMLEEQGALKKIHKSVTILNDLAHVRVDRHQLQQVFMNLFINARDAMPEGGTLSIRAGMEKYLGNPEEVPCKTSGVTMGRRKNDFRGAFNAFFSPENILVKIEISDNGSGIDADCLERIFDPFYTTKEPGHGTGLGLAISARIMDSFNGRITVESEIFKGSKFTVWLPGITG